MEVFYIRKFIYITNDHCWILKVPHRKGPTLEGLSVFSFTLTFRSKVGEIENLFALSECRRWFPSMGGCKIGIELYIIRSFSICLF